MSEPPDQALATRLLQQTERDDDSHAADLLQLVGAELRRLAAGYLKRERPGHTLQPTALVHEAYLKLIDSTVIRTGDRERFLAMAAWAMRQVLVDFARRRRTQRRGGDGWERVSLHPEVAVDAGAPSGHVDLLDLDDALTRFAQIHDQAARVVELRYFGGLTIGETAEVLDVSERMVSKYWHLARAWLGRELGSRDPS